MITQLSVYYDLFGTGLSFCLAEPIADSYMIQPIGSVAGSHTKCHVLYILSVSADT